MRRAFDNFAPLRESIVEQERSLESRYDSSLTALLRPLHTAPALFVPIRVKTFSDNVTLVPWHQLRIAKSHLKSFSRNAHAPRAYDNCHTDRTQRFFELLPALTHSRREPGYQPLR